MLAWQGFLWSARLYRPLLSAVKQSFLDTANHYERLGQGKAQYAAMLAFAALEPEETFTISELQTATRALPPSGLAETTRALVRALESAGERREEYWTHRVRPYLRRIWPKTRDIASQMISEQFARLAIGAGEQFPRHSPVSSTGCNRLSIPFTRCISSARPDCQPAFRGKRYSC